MKKLLGAAAILLGCIWAAMSRVRAGRVRERRLLSMRDALTELSRELAARRCGMKDLFRRLADLNEGKNAGAFFQSLCDEMVTLGEKCFSEIWRAAVADKLGALGEEAAQTLCALGECLGGSELALQCEALDRAAREMERLARNEREAMPDRRRMSDGLSLAAGALLVIMLI